MSSQLMIPLVSHQHFTFPSCSRRLSVLFWVKRLENRKPFFLWKPRFSWSVFLGTELACFAFWWTFFCLRLWTHPVNFPTFPSFSRQPAMFEWSKLKYSANIPVVKLSFSVLFIPELKHTKKSALKVTVRLATFLLTFTNVSSRNANVICGMLDTTFQQEPVHLASGGGQQTRFYIFYHIQKSLN